MMRWIWTCLNAVVFLTAGSACSAAPTTTPLGDYIALGVGATITPSTSATTGQHSSVLPLFSNSTEPLASTPTQQATTNGTTNVSAALASAEACLSSKRSYLVAQRSFLSSVVSSIGTVPANTTTETTTMTEFQRGVIDCGGVTRLTTLCDGHPRVVGTAACLTTLAGYTVTATITDPFGPSYPTYSAASPTCSVNPTDCQELYALNASLVYVSSLYEAVCSFTVSRSTTLSTNSIGIPCDNCQIGASSGRLLYWPVRTVSVPGNDNLCNATSVKVIGGTPTGTGPNTYVTEGITITSPSVGISLGGISRYDGCFATISSTILVVPPSEVTSVRGARALFTWESFAFQDLNYRCQATGSPSYIIQDEPGDDCYQEVPVSAYFGDHMAFDDWNEDLPSSLLTAFTIGNDYAPMLEPPVSWTAWANSLYNTTGCAIGVDGIWDPPKALSQAWSEASVTVPFQSTTSTLVPVSSSPVPAESAVTQAPQTNTDLRQGTSTSPAQTQTASIASETTAQASSANTAVDPPEPTSSEDLSQARQSLSTAVSQPHTGHNVAQSDIEDPSATTAKNDLASANGFGKLAGYASSLAAEAVSATGNAGTSSPATTSDPDILSHSAVIVGSQTYTEIPRISASSPDVALLVLGNEEGTTTVPAGFALVVPTDSVSGVSVSTLSDGLFAVQVASSAFSLSIGGSAAAIGASVYSAASSGVIVSQDPAASTPTFSHQGSSIPQTSTGSDGASSLMTSTALSSTTQSVVISASAPACSIGASVYAALFVTMIGICASITA